VPSVFISYRRDDTSAHAGRLADALIARFGRRNVFMDIDAISPGVDFEERIHEALAACDVVLVLIGDDWLRLQTPDGRPRLHDEGDFVRLEVVAALGRADVTVVPVLVEGVEMPPAKELPEAVAPLARRHAFELSDTHWRYDVGRLGDIVDEAAARGPLARLLRRLPRIPARAGIAIAAIAAATVVGVVLAIGGGGSEADPAAKIAACERAHGLSRPAQQRPTRAGESQIPPVSDPNATFEQHTFAGCTWPRAPGSDPDGYRAIAVTATNGPGDSEATGRSFADRIESDCGRLGVEYSFSKMGLFERLPAFVGAPGQIWAAGGSGFERVASSGPLNLPFTPLRNEVTVLRNASYRLDRVSCVG
jgi:hypothetical protein